MKKTILLILTLAFALHAEAQKLGRIDSSYGDMGSIVIDQGHGDYDEVVTGSVLGASGDLYLCGFHVSPKNDALISHLMNDGSIDNSFGNSGTARIDFTSGVSEYPQDMVRLSDGSLLVAGFYEGTQDEEAFVLKLKPNGSLDANFGTNGVVKFPALGDEQVKKIAVRPDGKIVLAGHLYAGFDEDFFIWLLNPDGSKVTGFGNQGQFIVDFDDNVEFLTSLAVDANSNMYIGGRSLGASNFVALAKVTAAGALDTDFDGDGRLLYLDSGKNTYLINMKFDKNAKLVGVGYVSEAGNSDLFIFRMNQSAVFDTTLNGIGRRKFYTKTGDPGVERWYGLDFQTDGKIVGCGTYTENSKGSLLSFRLSPNGETEPGFGNVDGYYFLNTSLFQDPTVVHSHVVSNARILHVGRTQNLSFDALVVAVNAVGITQLGVKDSYTHDLHVYPNPASSYVQVEGLEEDVALNLYSLQGRLVQTWKPGTTYLELNGGLKPGIYILRGQGASGIYRAKLQVQ